MTYPHLPKTRLLSLLISLASLIAHTGCAPQSKSANTPEPAFQPAPLVLATELFPLTKHTGTLRRTLDANPPQNLIYRLDHVSQNQWVLQIEGVRTTYLQQTRDGSILITREDEFTDAVTVTYNPPLIVLPAKLIMQNPVRGKSKMTVNSLKDGSQRGQGSCEYQVRLMGTRPVTTQSDTYDTYVVQTHRRIKLNVASASVKTQTSYAPQHGWLGEKIIKITQPLNLFKVKQTESLAVITPNPKSTK